MIEYLKGTLADLTPALAVIDCNGVGYGVNISLNTFSGIAYQLWGFSTRVERELFLLLTSVSGIGAAMARMILSAMTPAELCNIISEGNDKMLKQVKGIGPKAAQRIIVDLKDKIGALGVDATAGSGSMQNAQSSVINKEVQEEAVSALTMLGFSPAPTHKVVQQILKDEPDAPVEKVIKLALKML